MKFFIWTVFAAVLLFNVDLGAGQTTPSPAGAAPKKAVLKQALSSDDNIPVVLLSIGVIPGPKLQEAIKSSKSANPNIIRR